MVCTPDPGAVAVSGGLDVVVGRGLDAVASADTVLVTGTAARDRGDPRIREAIGSAAASGERIASICTGAFVLAQAGLLDGRAATTLWILSHEFTRRFPAVDLRRDVLFVEDGPILTSAGLSAGMDFVRTWCGLITAPPSRATARLVAAAPARPGKVPQIVEAPLPPERGTALAATRARALTRLREPLTLADLARHAKASVRTLTRRFPAERGTSALQWMLRQRVDRAREVLETTGSPLAQAARHGGLGSADSLRHHLLQRTGITPSTCRTTYARPPYGT
ncbi:DJ-1/PfpI family protein [Yinghuangia sp. ASG 101]|uniref:GlxA family transcriptional regulator n=1 Tax=Yinghuangia sp. ASG 101 TaxID=2896848 RepID=UPI001E643D79|nr:helix-turn-helix domain-containing protein [Yinghuangia sp. ASG 101]UGQ12044.1 DJ-1/PfpI family protein [Yinghuangia sp. ASG 101]